MTVLQLLAGVFKASDASLCLTPISLCTQKNLAIWDIETSSRKLDYCVVLQKEQIVLNTALHPVYVVYAQLIYKLATCICTCLQMRNPGDAAARILVFVWLGMTSNYIVYSLAVRSTLIVLIF